MVSGLLHLPVDVLLTAFRSPALFPTMFALVWKKQTRLAAIVSPIIGMAVGIAVWVVVAQNMYGTASIPALGMTFPCMYASIASAFVPLPITIALSYIWPDRDFEWSQLLTRITRVEDDEHGSLSAKASHFSVDAYFTPERTAYMKRMARVAFYVGILTFLCQWVLWPLPMYGKCRACLTDSSEISSTLI